MLKFVTNVIDVYNQSIFKSVMFVLPTAIKKVAYEYPINQFHGLYSRVT